MSRIMTMVRKIRSCKKVTTSSGPHQKKKKKPARFGTGIKRGLKEEKYGFTLTLERCGMYQQVSFEENTFDASIRTMCVGGDN